MRLQFAALPEKELLQLVEKALNSSASLAGTEPPLLRFAELAAVEHTPSSIPTSGLVMEAETPVAQDNKLLIGLLAGAGSAMMLCCCGAAIITMSFQRRQRIKNSQVELDSISSVSPAATDKDAAQQPEHAESRSGRRSQQSHGSDGSRPSPARERRISGEA